MQLPEPTSCTRLTKDQIRQIMAMTARQRQPIEDADTKVATVSVVVLILGIHAAGRRFGLMDRPGAGAVGPPRAAQPTRASAARSSARPLRMRRRCQSERGSSDAISTTVKNRCGASQSMARPRACA